MAVQNQCFCLFNTSSRSNNQNPSAPVPRITAFVCLTRLRRSTLICPCLSKMHAALHAFVFMRFYDSTQPIALGLAISQIARSVAYQAVHGQCCCRSFNRRGCKLGLIEFSIHGWGLGGTTRSVVNAQTFVPVDARPNFRFNNFVEANGKPRSVPDVD